MLHFVVASHGPFATALISSAKMVFGELINTTAICLTEEGGIEQFKKISTMKSLQLHLMSMALLCYAIWNAARLTTLLAYAFNQISIKG
ncbi:hypothetical protein [Vibrio taketomensis]|uniref:PTS sugar transporter subunit IIA domain-containing protein n=1 Tax=Vibrio taketomensis TaxID=2572923 RepID=UPI0013894EBD|nr:hypothetical protein [Vibrio taketomensis]